MNTSIMTISQLERLITIIEELIESHPQQARAMRAIGRLARLDQILATLKEKQATQ